MSDLFDSLNTRFSPMTQPAITPRLQQRFEGGADSDGFVEHHEERISEPVPAARRPSPELRRADDITPIVDAPQPEVYTETRINRQDVLREVPSEAAPQVARDMAPEQFNAPSAQPPSTERTLHTIETHDHVETFHTVETHRDTVVDRQTPAETRVVHSETTRLIAADLPDPVVLDTAPLPRASQPDRTPAREAPPQVSVRIGRIEVSAPAQPAPPPPPPRPVAKPASQSQTSGLTDYLGWSR